MRHNEKAEVRRLVMELLEPSNRYSRGTSYHIKHVFERITGFYISNDEMKSIMLELGYRPDSNTELNQRYKVRFKAL